MQLYKDYLERKNAREITITIDSRNQVIHDFNYISHDNEDHDYLKKRWALRHKITELDNEYKKMKLDLLLNEVKKIDNSVTELEKIHILEIKKLKHKYPDIKPYCRIRVIEYSEGTEIHFYMVAIKILDKWYYFESGNW